MRRKTLKVLLGQRFDESSRYLKPEYGSVLEVWCALEGGVFFFLTVGFLIPRAISASSRKRLLLGAPPGRFSQARSPAGPFKLYRGAIHRSLETLGSLSFLRGIGEAIILYSCSLCQQKWAVCADLGEKF